jgi:hypothetical protein
MSFRGFVYHCMLWGACAGLAGGLASRLATAHAGMSATALWWLATGSAVGLAVGLVDALACRPARRLAAIGSRGLVGMGCGAVSGVAGGLLARLETPALSPLGWATLGLVAGAGPGVAEVLAALLWAHNPAGPLGKLRNGAAGGALGGLLGGLAILGLHRAWAGLGLDPASDDLWTPALAESAALGGCTGLMAGVAQVLLRRAWLCVEAGPRPGRQVILSGPETTLGDAASCDVALHADDGEAAPVQARIVRQGGDFVLADAGAAAGTFVNDQRLAGPAVLHSGDLIRVGRNALLFLRR